ncbi:myosin-kinesin ATPase superfamily-like protein [Aureococcus anophagefferens]|nr:myosin-kinesin ATPase superfamily-like protein [Aureococcus anophagefferens]
MATPPPPPPRYMERRQTDDGPRTPKRRFQRYSAMPPPKPQREEGRALSRVDLAHIEVKCVYFVPHPKRVWVKVLVLALDKSRCRVRDLEDGAELDLEPALIPFLPVNEHTAEDMTTLYHLHDPGIIENLEQRSDLRQQRPYTRIANVLIAVNPLRPVPDPDEASFRGGALSDAPPHPWAIAETALRQMVLEERAAIRGRANQSVVISGESGAGKTETAKIVLGYLCRRVASASSGPSDLDRRLLDSNPILEALGNARTLRSDNSSRFGKFLKLQFSRATGAVALAGATVETYLLERSRVVGQTDGERNYHALYQWVAGASALDASKLKLLKKPSDFRYLSASSCATIAGVDDAAAHGATARAFAAVGLAERDAASPKKRGRGAYFDLVGRCLGAALHLGNVTFDGLETAESGDRASAVSSRDHAARPALNAAVHCLGGDIAADALEALLVRRTIAAPSTRGRSQSFYVKERDAEAAALARDAVARDVYARCFDAVVAALGASMTAATDAALDFIGVLDIFGFEAFARNDLEQLLINFANESLQATFNKAVLVAERDVYAFEGIVVEETVAAPDDTEACVELIAARKPPSVFSILDDASKQSRSDGAFCRDLHEALAGKTCFAAPHKKDVKDTFVVAHYAGAVAYTTGRFVSKNSNKVPEGLGELLEASAAFRGLAAYGRAPDRAGDDSLSRNFATQMRELCGLLDSTTCSFVRCLKPNHKMAVGVFDRACVASQLRAQGIPQTCDVLRCGMPTRANFDAIEAKYREPAAKLEREAAGFDALASLDARGFTAAVLWALSIPPSCYRMGRSKVFFRTGAIALLDRLYAVDLGSPDGLAFAGRLRYFASRRRWRSALAKVTTARAFLDAWRSRASVARVARFVQARYRYYVTFGRGKRRRRARRIWRRALCKAAVAVEDVRAVARPASEIVAERMTRGEIGEKKGRALLDKIEEERAGLEEDDGAFAVGGNPLHGHAGDAEPGAPDPATPRVRASVANLGGVRVDDLLRDAGALEDSVGDERVAADIRRAMGRLQLAKGALTRWHRVRLYRAVERWRDFNEAALSAKFDGVLEARLAPTSPRDAREVKSWVDRDVRAKSDEGIEMRERETRVGDAWYNADLRSALHNLRDVLAKAPKLVAKTEELDEAGLAAYLAPDAPELTDDELFVRRPSNSFDKSMEVARRNLSTSSERRRSLSGLGKENAAGDGDDKVTSLQQQIALLKKQLNAAGVQAVELVPLAEAREKMNAAVKRLMDGDMDAEKDVEKYDQIIRMHPDYEKEEAAKAEQWVKDTKPANEAAQNAMRCLVPPDVRSASLADLGDSGLPPGVVRRLWTKKATWLVRFHPEDTAKLHIADLLSKYNNQGLDIVEMRGVWASLPDVFDNDGDGKKAQWKANFRTKLMELVTKEGQGRLSRNEARNPGYKDLERDKRYFDPDAPLVRAGIMRSNPYAAQEKPVIKVDASVKPREKPRDEAPVKAGDVAASGTLGDGETLEPRQTFLVLVNGELRAYDKESDLKLAKPPAFAVPVRGRRSDAALGECDGGFELAAGALKLAFAAADAPAWKAAVAAELDYVDPKAKMRAEREAKRKADEERKRKAEAEAAAAGGGGKGGKMSGGLMAALAGAAPRAAAAAASSTPAAAARAARAAAPPAGSWAPSPRAAAAPRAAARAAAAG